jgi:hypothetical protein
VPLPTEYIKISSDTCFMTVILTGHFAISLHSHHLKWWTYEINLCVCTYRYKSISSTGSPLEAHVFLFLFRYYNKIQCIWTVFKTYSICCRFNSLNSLKTYKKKTFSICKEPEICPWWHNIQKILASNPGLLPPRSVTIFWSKEPLKELNLLNCN